MVSINRLVYFAKMFADIICETFPRNESDVTDSIYNVLYSIIHCWIIIILVLLSFLQAASYPPMFSARLGRGRTTAIQVRTAEQNT